MGRSRVSWAVGVIAPWCLGIGLLVSITADAGQNATVGGSFAALAARAAPEPEDLIPADTIALTGDVDSFGIGRSAVLTQASFDLGQPADYTSVADEIEPRMDMKTNAGAMPSIDRSHKGAPALGLRPTFDTQLRRPGGLSAFALSQMIGPHDDAMPAASFSLQDSGGPLDGATVFAPWAEGEDPQDDTDETPRADRLITMRPAAIKEHARAGRRGADRGVPLSGPAESAKCVDRSARRGASELRGAAYRRGRRARAEMPCRSGLFRSAKRAGGGPGRRGASRPQQGDIGPVSGFDLRRRLSEQDSL
jgi:hypothetical protein